eukprot:gene51766-12368_t
MLAGVRTMDDARHLARRVKGGFDVTALAAPPPPWGGDGVYSEVGPGTGAQPAAAAPAAAAGNGRAAAEMGVTRMRCTANCIMMATNGAATSDSDSEELKASVKSKTQLFVQM